MLRRLVPLLAVIALCQANPAAARGVPRQGLEIDKTPFTINNTVGHLQADWRWYTVGLHTGTVHLTSHLYGTLQPLSPSYGIEVILLKGREFVAQGEIGCYRTQVHCRQVLHVSYKVAQPGPYYILIIGLGADAISYRLHVNGPVYPLHCAKSC